MPAPVHPDEKRRVASLHSTCLLDTPRETSFDRVVFTLAQYFNSPIAAISLIDTDRQWLKSAVGLTIRETPREHAFCAHTILVDDILLVEDAAFDARFSSSPLVTGPPHIRFYAGVPLRTMNGMPLGAVCVMDYKPRSITGLQRMMLQSMAAAASSLLDGCNRQG